MVGHKYPVTTQKMKLSLIFLLKLILVTAVAGESAHGTVQSSRLLKPPRGDDHSDSGGSSSSSSSSSGGGSSSSSGGSSSSSGGSSSSSSGGSSSSSGGSSAVSGGGSLAVSGLSGRSAGFLMGGLAFLALAAFTCCAFFVGAGRRRRHRGRDRAPRNKEMLTPLPLDLRNTPPQATVPPKPLPVATKKAVEVKKSPPFPRSPPAPISMVPPPPPAPTLLEAVFSRSQRNSRLHCKVAGRSKEDKNVNVYHIHHFETPPSTDSEEQKEYIPCIIPALSTISTGGGSASA